MAINLSKGNSIRLEKGNRIIEDLTIGVNWGIIKAKGLLGSLGFGEKRVDLDVMVSMFTDTGEEFDTVYYGKLTSADNAVKLSGDDRVGDMHGDDKKDNESVYVRISMLHPSVKNVLVYINSYKGDDFGKIPYSRLRVIDGTPFRPKEVLAEFNLSAEASFAGYSAMLLGRMEKQNDGGWVFFTVGQPLKGGQINDIYAEVKQYFKL